MIWPQLDQSPLFSSINFLLPVQAQANTTASQTSLDVGQWYDSGLGHCLSRLDQRSATVFRLVDRPIDQNFCRTIT